ncbi:MAG: response regulator [Pseudomonadota bacterium]
MAHTTGKSTFDVMVVEDDNTYLSFWKRFLNDMGITNYTLITNPYKAKDLLIKGGCRLLISDINLPDINGYELAKVAHEHSVDCEVILTTAYLANLSRFDIGTCSFHLLYKPFSNLEELAKLIKLLTGGDVSMEDMSEDSFSENEDFPMVTEWKL